MDEFYLAMSKAIKARDHAMARVDWWRGKVFEAEQEIEGLIATQHVDKTETTPQES